MRDLVVAARPAAVGELERVEALVAVRVDADCEAFAFLADGAAVRVDEPRLVLDRALRGLDAGQALDLARTAAEKAGAAVPPRSVLVATSWS